MKTKTPTLNVLPRLSLRLAPALVLATLIACCPFQTRADTIALSFFPALANTGTTANRTTGWAFTLSSPVLVTQLGLFDDSNDGLEDSHLVTIWTSTGTQEAQTTIPSGTGATLTDGFRYASIAPVLLPAGSYTIGGSYSAGSSDGFAVQVMAITTASGVTYDGSRDGLGFAFPPDNFAGFSNGDFGPNFQFTTPTSLPDTGTTGSLFGLSLMGLAFLRRKLC
jgi:hypothetical protein